MKLMGKPTGTGTPGTALGGAGGRGRRGEQQGSGLALGLVGLSLQGTSKDPTNTACYFLAV